MLAVESIPAEKKHRYPQSFNELLAARGDLDLTFNIYRQLIQTNEMHKENFGLRHVISDQLLERYSVADAISMAKTEAPESSFEYLETSIAGAAATNKRQELVQLLSTNDAIFSNSAVSYIALQLGYEAPKSIEKIVATIAEKRNDYSVTQGYVRSWSTIDSMASAQWLAQLPAGIARDGGILGLLESFEPDERLEREDLLQWKSQIKDTDVIREAESLLK